MVGAWELLVTIIMFYIRLVVTECFVSLVHK